MSVIEVNNVVACQNATIRFGRGRRPRGPTYARGTIRSLFENQELARQRTAHDVATRPPCRNLFSGRSFQDHSVLFVSSCQFIFSLSVQGSFFVYRSTFSFLSVSLSVSLSVFVCFFRGFHFRVLHCRVFVPAIFGAAGTTHVGP
jgi:hypothetical protein